MEVLTEKELREQRLKKKKRNRYLTIGLLTGGVCLLCVAYYALEIYQEYRAEKEREEAANAIVSYELADFLPEEVVSYTLTNSEYSLTFVQTEEGWSCEAEEERLVNQTTAESVISEMGTLTSSKIAAETTEKKAEFGFDEPEITLSVVLQDGTEQVFSLGDKTQTGSGYYLMSTEKEEIYLVDSAVYTTLTTAYDDFFEEPETETADGEAVDTEQEEDETVEEEETETE